MTTPTPIWQLPPPPAGHQWHMPDTVTAKELGEEHRLCVVGERISPGAQYFERGTSSWSSTSKSFSDPLGNTETYRVPITTPFPPLPQSAEPVAEEKLVPMNEVRKLADEAKDGINVAFRFLEACQRSLHQTESESDQLRKELEETREHLQGNLIASRNECQRLTTENAALKEKLDRWQVVGNSVMKVVTGKEGPLSDSDVEAELTRLRSQLTWTPVPLEGITRTDERNKLVVWVSDSTSETGLEWLHGISRRATHYISIESLRQFLPLPSPPETEEQKAGDSFNKWWQTKAHQDLAEVSGCNKATALAIWLAAKQSTGGPA